MKLSDVTSRLFLEHHSFANNLFFDENKRIFAYECPVCKDIHTKWMELSASSLNQFIPCPRSWCHYKLLKTDGSMPQRWYPRNSGHRVHEVESNITKIQKRYGTKLFKPNVMRHITVPDLRKQLDAIKLRLLSESEKLLIFPHLSNVSRMDSTRWVELIEHFDGDFEQAWKYWVPDFAERKQHNFDTKTILIVDRGLIIPPGFKNYRNERELLAILDFKPGKIKDTGGPVYAEELSKYGYGNDFKRQLTFYAYNLKHRIPLEDRIVGGMFYKTGQYLLERLTNYSYSALEKQLENYWNSERFPRKITMKYHCEWCDYMPTCLNTYKLQKGDESGEPDLILDLPEGNWSFPGVVLY